MHASKDSMWWEILKFFGTRQGPSQKKINIGEFRVHRVVMGIKLTTLGLTCVPSLLLHPKVTCDKES